MDDAVRTPLHLADREGNRLFLQHSNFRTEDVYNGERKGVRVTADVGVTYEDGTPFACMPPLNTTPIDNNTTGILYFENKIE
jgi:hypothetical protein